MLFRFPILTATALAVAAPVMAETRTEAFTQGSTAITVHLHPFLTEEETTILRIVGESPDALAVFMPSGSGFGALALAPEDGFIRDGLPVDSAAAVAELPDLAQARDAALAQCNSLRSGGAGCVVVLEIEPR
jgi:hypothetical protein